MAQAATKVSCFKRSAGQNRIEVYTYIGSPGEYISDVESITGQKVRFPALL